jgi:hypothetical protein
VPGLRTEQSSFGCPPYVDAAQGLIRLFAWKDPALWAEIAEEPIARIKRPQPGMAIARAHWTITAPLKVTENVPACHTMACETVPE